MFNRECHYKFKIRKIQSSIIKVISTYNQKSLNTKFDRDFQYKEKKYVQYKVQSRMSLQLEKIYIKYNMRLCGFNLGDFIMSRCKGCYPIVKDITFVLKSA